MLKPFHYLFILRVVGYVVQHHAREYYVNKEYLDDLIKKVNNANPHWTAGHNFEDGESIHNLAGSVQKPEIMDQELEVHPKASDLQDAKVGSGRPAAFDGLEAWKNICPSTAHVWNQGECASDWVIAPVSAIADRLCIFSNGTTKVRLSPELPLACCSTCGWGCKKGYPGEVFKYWVKNGLVSGGAYHSNQGCQPYTIKPEKSVRRISKHKSNTPECKKECYNQNYQKSFAQDIIKGASYYKTNCPGHNAYEIWKNGPLTATFRLYEDFLAYKEGIYHHVDGKFLGLLTVKVVGYNDTSNPPYWLALNSWGKRWGWDGTFKIRRGVNECMFDSILYSAYPIQESDEEYDESDDSDGY